MRKLLLILLLLPSLSFCQIKKGTTMLISLYKDTMIMMEDSRSEHISDNFSERHYEDTTNKIASIGKYVFGIAGLSNFKNVNLYDLVKNSFDTTKSLCDNSLKIKEKVFTAIDKLKTQLTNDEISKLLIFDDSLHFANIATIDMIGFENNHRVIFPLEIQLLKQGDSYITNINTRECITIADDVWGLIDDGYHSNIQQLIKHGLDIHHLQVKELAELISIEANHTEHVGHNYNYVILTQNQRFGVNRIDVSDKLKFGYQGRYYRCKNTFC